MSNLRRFREPLYTTRMSDGEAEAHQMTPEEEEALIIKGES